MVSTSVQIDYQRFLKMVCDRAEKLRLGPGLDDKSEVGPLIHEEARQKVAEYVNSIVALDVHSPAFSEKAADVRQMGDADIRATLTTALQEQRQTADDFRNFIAPRNRPMDYRQLTLLG